MKNKYTIIHNEFTGRPRACLTRAHRVECTQEDLRRYLKALSPWFVFEGWPQFDNGSLPELLDTGWCEVNQD